MTHQNVSLKGAVNGLKWQTNPKLRPQNDKLVLSNFGKLRCNVFPGSGWVSDRGSHRYKFILSPTK